MAAGVTDKLWEIADTLRGSKRRKLIGRPFVDRIRRWNRSMIEIAAAVYMILQFPGPSGEVRVLPMQTMELCQRQSKEIVSHYNDDGRAFRLFAYCIETGIQNSN